MATPYRPINSVTGEIRILILLPERHYHEPLKCELESAFVSLDSSSQSKRAPDYEAISYCWGDPTPCEPCELNGFPVKIPRSAAEVLRRFRLPGAPRRLWIDALCINQENVPERGEQVGLMAAVYSQCARCLIWLGTDDKGTARKAFDTVNNVLRVVKEAKEDSTNPMLQMFAMFSELDIARSVFKESFAQRLKGTRGESGFKFQDEKLDMFTLLRRPWFQRKWVVQEAALAPNPEVYCGGHTAPLSSLLEAGDSLYQHRAWPHNQEEFLIVRDLHLLSRYVSPEGNDDLPVGMRTLVALLPSLRTRLSTDPKDAVFSLLGLVERDSQFEDSFKVLLKTDYQRSLSDILASATKYATIQAGTLDVLRFVLPRINEDPETSKIPSWVPRWHLRHEDMGMGGNRMSPNHEPPMEDGKKLELFDPHDTATLRCRGEIIDTVSDRFDAPNKSIFTNARLLAAFISQVRKLLSSLTNQMYSREEESEVLASTLFLGRHFPMQDKRGKEAEYFLHFERYINDPDCIPAPLPESEVMPTMRGRPLEEQAFVSFSMISRLALPNRAFFSTTGGLVGAGPVTMKTGDVLAILHGFSLPVVLRPRTDGCYEYLEDCYAHGLMRGRQNWPAGVVGEEKIISLR